MFQYDMLLDFETTEAAQIHFKWKGFFQMTIYCENGQFRRFLIMHGYGFQIRDIRIVLRVIQRRLNERYENRSAAKYTCMQIGIVNGLLPSRATIRGHDWSDDVNQLC